MVVETRLHATSESPPPPTAAGLSTSRLAKETARLVAEAFDAYRQEFRAVTLRATDRFRTRDWHGMAADAKLRLSIRAGAVDGLLDRVRATLGARLDDRVVWIAAKAVFSGLVDERDDWELAETFFNSTTRRVFSTVGVDADVEFVHSDHPSPPRPAAGEAFDRFEAPAWDALIEAIVRRRPELTLSEAAIRRDAAAVAERIAAAVTDARQPDGRPHAMCAADVATAPFFRGERAYLVGRLRPSAGDAAAAWRPLVLCFRHEADELAIDAVLLDEADVRLLFSYTRSYFHVDAPRPYDLVEFLKSIMPHKSRAELYIAVGFHKHGKTEFYRHALRQLATTTDLYERPPGARGLVMSVFTRPSYPVVFKVIKDLCEHPKDCTRREVIDRYRLVFEHDRAGRLIDAQEYEYLTFARRRFSQEVLDELLALAAETVSVHGDRVVVTHCYAERRVTPLDVYLRQVDRRTARAAIVDYGQAIKDLALTNLFPGDLLLKNFGVTRQHRVVFYDYDEVRLLTSCRFYKLPQPDDPLLDMAGEPWFGVSEADMYPEEFIRFLGLTAELHDLFCERHGDLLTPRFWRGVQARLAAGEVFHVSPYGESSRLRPDSVRLLHLFGRNNCCTDIA